MTAVDLPTFLVRACQLLDNFTRTCTSVDQTVRFIYLPFTLLLSERSLTYYFSTCWHHLRTCLSIYRYLAFQSVHEPLQAPQDLVDSYLEIADYQRRVLAAMVTAMDTSVGRAVAGWERAGLWNDTVLIFTVCLQTISHSNTRALTLVLQYLGTDSGIIPVRFLHPKITHRTAQ